MEKCCTTIFAKHIMNIYIRIAVLIFWVIAAAIAIYGITQVRTMFSMFLFIPKGSATEKFFEMDLSHFKTGFDVNIMVENPNLDFSSEENQL